MREEQVFALVHISLFAVPALLFIWWFVHQIRKAIRDDASVRSTIERLNSEHGLNFPLTKEERAERLLGDQSHGIYFDFDKRKIAVVYDAKNIAMHDVIHIREWESKWIEKNERESKHSMILTLANLDKPILTVGFNSARDQKKWAAKLALLINHSD